MKSARKKSKKLVKPNVIPILDAVFIFIFFLLMSAQFLEIYEIGTDAPAVKTLTEEQKNKKEPLSLTLIVKKQQLILQKGMPSTTITEIALNGEGNYDLTKLEKELVKIKTNHGDENSIIIKPEEKVEYKKIVWIMDTVREVAPKSPAFMVVGKDGNKKETRTLFDQIIFETII